MPNASLTIALVCLLFSSLSRIGHAYSATPANSNASKTNSKQHTQPVGNVLILDHLNINHEKGRHDLLKAFYFDFLQCAVDPRKADNLDAGSKTLWANIGSHQFHLPEGKPDAQVLEGVVTLAYPDLQSLEDRYGAAQEAMEGSKFALKRERSNVLLVTDPWGSKFRLVSGDEDERDARGTQPGDKSEGLAMRDLTIYTPADCNMEGIGRFYEQILQAPILESCPEKCTVSVGPQQTLTFSLHPDGKAAVAHDDMRDDGEVATEGRIAFLSNYGPHVSMYVADLAATYKRADELGVCYVNPRFKRRAYTLDEARNDCMFRCIDIVDPDNVEAGPILKLEHEIRSVVKRDGSKYKSCPFDEIPNDCSHETISRT